MSASGKGVTVCTHCGKQHDLPLSFAADYPDPYLALSESDRRTRAQITSDQCILDGAEFYLRGCLELPVRGTGDVFLWGVWARVHEKDFDTVDQYWETEGREHMIGPFKGRMANALDLYPQTTDLRLELRIQPAGVRPLFILEEPGHPLAVEQRIGLSPQKAQEYACWLLNAQC